MTNHPNRSKQQQAKQTPPNWETLAGEALESGREEMTITDYTSWTTARLRGALAMVQLALPSLKDTDPHLPAIKRGAAAMIKELGRRGQGTSQYKTLDL